MLPQLNYSALCALLNAHSFCYNRRVFQIASRGRFMHLSHAAAQALMVAAQGLHRRPERAASKADLLAMIRHMGVLQIDTIHVVARSPYVVLWSRLGAYPQE